MKNLRQEMYVITRDVAEIQNDQRRTDRIHDVAQLALAAGADEITKMYPQIISELDRSADAAQIEAWAVVESQLLTSFFRKFDRLRGPNLLLQYPHTRRLREIASDVSGVNLVIRSGTAAKHVGINARNSTIEYSSPAGIANQTALGSKAYDCLFIARQSVRAAGYQAHSSTFIIDGNVETLGEQSQSSRFKIQGNVGKNTLKRARWALADIAGDATAALMPAASNCYVNLRGSALSSVLSDGANHNQLYVGGDIQGVNYRPSDIVANPMRILHDR